MNNNNNNIINNININNINILRKAKAGYMLDDIKVNQLLFMDDLKLFFEKRKKKLDSLVSTVQLFSRDIGMEFGLKKCGVTVLKRGS